MEINAADYMAMRSQLYHLGRKVVKYEEAAKRHHDQKADDRCRFDDDELYAACRLPPADYCVGDKKAMLANCERFIENRCDGGKWPSYVELEEKIQQMEERHQKDQEKLRHFDYLLLAVPLAYEEGFRDCRNGVCRNDNPYGDGTGCLESLEGQAWDAGWILRSQRGWNRTERDMYRDRLGRLLGAVKSYFDIKANHPMVAGEAERELQATVAYLDGKEYDGRTWANLCAGLERRIQELEAEVARLHNAPPPA